MSRDEPAFVVDGTQYYGLTKREYAAVQICAGLMGNEQITKPDEILIAVAARKIADALFDELEKEGAK
jgi:protein-L-isoaspartate O-methyltransferase